MGTPRTSRLHDSGRLGVDDAQRAVDGDFRRDVTHGGPDEIDLAGATIEELAETDASTATLPLQRFQSMA